MVSPTVQLIDSLAEPFFLSAIASSALSFAVACLLLWRLWVITRYPPPRLAAPPRLITMFKRPTRLVPDVYEYALPAITSPWWLDLDEEEAIEELTAAITELRPRIQLPKGTHMTTTKNKQGMIADYAQSTQFEPNETEFACGFFAGGLNKYAGPPGKGATGTQEQVDQWSDNEYKQVYGSFGADMSGGISVEAMHAVLQHAGCHYFDIEAINPGSTQASDIAHIHRAIDAGYPVVCTIVEATVRDLTGDIQGGGNPYSWNPVCNADQCYTHVFTIVGYDSHTLYVVDPANVVGPLQGSNHVRPWPRHYDVFQLEIHWATIVQLPFLASIPSGDPTSWPANFSAQQQAAPAQEEYMTIDITNPVAASWYTQDSGVNGTWHLKGSTPPLSIGGAILTEYKSMPSLGAAGITELGKPITNEIPLMGKDGKQLAGGAVVQGFERGGLVFDPQRAASDPPYSKGRVYKALIGDYWTPKPGGGSAVKSAKEAAYDAIKALVAKGP